MSSNKSTLESKFDALLKVLLEEKEKRKENEVVVNNHFDKVENRLEKLHENVDSLRADTGVSFDKVDEHFEEVKQELKKIEKATGYKEQLKNLKGLP